jgi:RimJ/RimL family protein N-acetyltransferase
MNSTQPIGTYTTSTGQSITLRLITKADAPLLVDFFHQLSPESKRLRFHLYTTRIPEEKVWQEARRLSDLDPQRQMAILATYVEDDAEERVVGVARFARAKSSDTEAEVAVVIRDDFQRRGLGKELLLTLADRARLLGITHFSAWVMAGNYRLMKLIKGLELKELESDVRHGEIKIRAPIT